MRGRRRAARRLLGVAMLCGALALSACTAPSARLGPGEQRIAGGVTAGIYYGYGEHFAAELRGELGLDIAVDETHGSVDNLQRVGAGEALLGFAQGDTAADAVAGSGDFDEPQAIRAVARVYDEYVHVVVPADSPIRRVSELAGHRVSLGAPNSGVQVIASRVLEASEVPADAIENPALGLAASIQALRAGEIAGFFWVGGLPTPGLADLAAESPIRLLPIEAGTVERVNAGHAGVYRVSDFPVGVYGVEAPSATMTVPNLLVTRASAPEELVHDITRVLFERRTELASRIAAAEYLDRRQAIFTGPIALHPGAARYYREAHR